ncbi:hypothetical protein Poly59_22210 [Rubripirellula reticaptiva]|uniref:Uncharacterized protein n=1 Tax=Rubripirellula reticaptiva TaxID=2528013 RepID=A0A5C6F3L1_9BACT|nr:hypothetical protein Poly59_22210 [Rubripirellula reticaptiva]
MRRFQFLTDPRLQWITTNVRFVARCSYDDVHMIRSKIQTQIKVGQAYPVKHNGPKRPALFGRASLGVT